MSDRDQNIIETLRTGNRDLRARAEAAEKKLAKYEENYTAIVSEKCWDDENHCPCVPHLRKRIEELEARLSSLEARAEEVEAENERLEEHGRFSIDREFGRIVVGRLIEDIPSAQDKPETFIETVNMEGQPVRVPFDILKQLARAVEIACPVVQKDAEARKAQDEDGET